MKNDKNLYFIPILIKIFDSKDIFKNFEEAIEEIVKLGKEEEYQEGYKNFSNLIEFGIESLLEKEGYRDILIDRIITMIHSDEIKISQKDRLKFINKIKNIPKLAEKYAKLNNEYFVQNPVKINVYKEKQLFHTELIEDELEFDISNIEPGHYIIELSNGRLLWEGNLTKEDLVLGLLNSESEFSLAADTEESEAKPSKFIEIIKNEIIMEIYSGLEFGKIKIVLK